MVRWLPASRATGGRAIYWLLLFALLAAGAAVPPFRTADNLSNVLTQSAALGLVAIGQTFVIAAGLIDLSVGQLLGLVVVLSCSVMDGHSERTVWALLLAVCLGGGVGALNGVLVNALRIHPLILTFGMLSILQGSIFTYTEGSVGATSPEVAWLARGRLSGVPVALVVLLLAMLVGHVLFTRTRFGQHLRAIGGNPESARRNGVAVARVRLLAFTVSGLGAALGGVLVAGRLGSGYPNAGLGFELDAIVAVVLGGTPLAGGRGSVLGTVAAVILLAVVSNVLNLTEVSAFVQILAKGLIVVGAVIFSRRRDRAER